MCVAIYQKEFTKKPIKNIIEEMIELGYKELKLKHFHPKRKNTKKFFLISSKNIVLKN